MGRMEIVDPMTNAHVNARQSMLYPRRVGGGFLMGWLRISITLFPTAFYFFGRLGFMVVSNVVNRLYCPFIGVLRPLKVKVNGRGKGNL